MNRRTLITTSASAFACSIPCALQSQSFSFFKRNADQAIFRKAKRYGLVSVERVAPDVFIELLYKVDSAAGKPLYHPDMPALVHQSTGEKLRKASQAVRRRGYALKLWDGWRPPEAHMALWNAVKDPKFVVPPEKGLSWHCYGISVDVTLVKPDGSPVEMPTGFDDFSDRAASNYTGGDSEIASRVRLLQDTMTSLGFRTIRSEWWHFDDMKATGGVHRVTAADLGIPLP